MTSPSCDRCASTKCVLDGNAASQPKSSGPNVGAIAGGVVGGVIALAALLLLIWWFVIRPRREERRSQQEKSDTFAAQRSERKSTQSIASTVLTRASNVIQIAYIPGVTNRSPPETPASLVPPVPPLPGATPDQHFFMPGDLRDSSWTATTGHQSISPTLRSSVATTIYRNDAIVSAVPAQQIQRSRANIVSVHNGPGGSGDSTPTQPVPVMITPRDAPAVPAITSSQLARAEAMKAGPGSSIVARQVVAKPVMVRGPSMKKKDGQSSTESSMKEVKPSTANSANSSNQFGHHTSTFDDNSSDEDDDDTRRSTPSHSTGAKASASVKEDSHSKSPFSDSASTSHIASAQIQQNSLYASQTPPPRVQSPFSDANEVS
ncbi:uncharacterized protein N7477_007178 [Penicillium maclennaniae]|uniref:uncharacterized protein n=1 Tax=Penicillium maclennaniae TaxID=1343394 RepID=UPI002541C299|nr:uncharacterized protein N7477_007178 [Penicillium maclennaniae]KAJ5668608.1 hypothetical protein N7477_007178 [Penicillium maclennaniae]